jgi:hypothetical protein
MLLFSLVGLHLPCSSLKLRTTNPQLQTPSKPLRSPPSERMDRPRSCYDLPTMRQSLGYEIFFSRFDGDPLCANHQRIAALHHNHVFVVLMHMCCRRRRLVTSPKCHLTPIRPVINVSLHPGRRLTASRNPICRAFHELWKILHRLSFFPRMATIPRSPTPSKSSIRAQFSHRSEACQVSKRDSHPLFVL